MFYNIPTSATNKTVYLYCISQSQITRSLLIQEKIGLSLDGTGTETKALVIVPNSLSSDPSWGDPAQEWGGIRQRMGLDAHNPHSISNRIPYSQVIFPARCDVSNRFCVVSLSPWSFLPSVLASLEVS